MSQLTRPRVVLLSGPVCAGKSDLAAQLLKRHGAGLIRSSDLIRSAKPNLPNERAALQRAGEALDRADGGAWVKTALARLIETSLSTDSSSSLFVLDSARIQGQIDAVREAFESNVHHVHLTASLSELEKRYLARNTEIKELISYADLRKNRTERNIEKLAPLADIVVETDRCTLEAVYVRSTALLGLYSRSINQLVDVLVGGQYGSEGKGNIVGHIAPEYNLLVRVGGPNAGHKVFGYPIETYYHLPSGTQRAPNSKLLLGAGAVLNVEKLLIEIQDHRVEASRLSIDPQAMIINQDDIDKEADLQATISSTKQGVGAASARKIMGRSGGVRLAKDVPELRPFIRESQELLEKAYMNHDKVLLEGTQGTSLSLHHGPYPYVTSRDTTVAGCLADAGIAPARVRRTVMVCRTHPIRVGGPSGPMANELTYEELAERSGIPIGQLKATETTTTTKRQRRLADFDWAQLRRSALLNGPTDIALTFVDYIDIRNRDAYRLEQLTSATLRFVEEVERVAGVPASLISTDFNWRNVIDRRAW